MEARLEDSRLSGSLCVLGSLWSCCCRLAVDRGRASAVPARLARVRQGQVEANQSCLPQQEEDTHTGETQALKPLTLLCLQGCPQNPGPSSTQVASHAQKYFARLQGTTKRKSRFTSLEEKSSTSFPAPAPDAFPALQSFSQPQLPSFSTGELAFAALIQPSQVHQRLLHQAMSSACLLLQQVRHSSSMW